MEESARLASEAHETTQTHKLLFPQKCYLKHAIPPPLAYKLPMQRSMATGISHLSQELIDEIVDHFFDSDDESCIAPVQPRSTCALISRVFRERSQKHLFTFLEIFMTEGENTVNIFKRLNDVFSMNPGLVYHIRSLELIICTKDVDSDMDSNDQDSNDRWLYFADPNFVACMTHIFQSGTSSV